MVSSIKHPKTVLRPLNHNEESSVRIQLSAVCHLLEHYGWSDAILNHVSARVPHKPQHFMMNPFGLMYSEISASDLVTLNFDGEPIGPPSWPTNKAGIILHSAIYEARPDIQCVIHTHTPYGVAVSTLKDGLACHDQMAILFHNAIGYHDFEGIVVGESEKRRIAQDLANHKCLILRNHGLVATGRTVAEAFWNYYYLEFACKVHILALSTQLDLHSVPEQIKAHAFEQHEYFCNKEAPTRESSLPGNYDVFLSALMRMLDRKGSIYA